MAPFGKAMGLIDGQEVDGDNLLQVFKLLNKLFYSQPFRRNIEQAQIPRLCLRHKAQLFVRIYFGIDKFRRGNAVVLQGQALIAHQGF